MKREILPHLIRMGRTLRTQIFRPPVHQEVDEEFAFHVEMRIREYLAAGMTTTEARAAAIRRFGDIDEVKAVCRRLGQQRGRRAMITTWVREIVQDGQFASRHLRKSPGLAVAAILTLGLGIGANTAVFSVVNGVLLRPLPFEDPGQLVEVRMRYLPSSGFDIPRFPMSLPELLDYRRANRSFELLGYYNTGTRTLTGPEGDPVRASTVYMNVDFMRVLGVEPALGRWITPEEDVPTVAAGLISHDLWVSRFGSDPGIVGRTIEASGNSFLVTGVMPESFAFPSARFQLFENFGADEANPGNRSSHSTVGIGRLKPGVGLEMVEAEAEGIHAGWAESFPHNVAHFPIFEPLADNLVGTDVRRALTILMGAVGVILLIAAVNVANLLMARGESRQHEMALRGVLGAGRGRIVRQLLTESVILSMLGGLLGIGVAYVGVDAILSINPDALPRAELIGLDGPVLLFTAVITIATAMLFGLAPAAQAGRAPASLLSGSTRSTATIAQRRLRRVLVASEVALSLVVVLCAGLLGRSLRALTAVDPGVVVEGRLTFQVSPQGPAYRDPAAVVRFYDELQTRLSAIPGVSSVASVAHMPLSGALSRGDFLIEAHDAPAQGEPIWSAQWTAVLPGYFETMGIRPTRGRTLNDRDRIGSEPVVVVSQETVDAYFGGEDALGARIGFDRDTIYWARIVGIVPPTRTRSLDGEVLPQVYYTVSQGIGHQLVPSFQTVVLRTSVEPTSVTPLARSAVRAIDSRIPLANVRTMEDVFRTSVAQPTLIANLLGSFAIIALLLAGVGIYGVVSYSVAKRTREIGIRLALGAERSSVSRLMIREGAWPAVVGVLVGVPASLWVTGFLRDLLYEVSPRDPVIFVCLPALLVVLAVASSYVPARRALRLEPTEALRDG